MSQDESSRKTIKEILNDWLHEFGHEENSKYDVSYWTIDKDDQRYAMECLIETLLKEGYEKEYILKDSFTVEVIKTLTGHKSKNLAGWQGIIRGRWVGVCNNRFANPQSIVRVEPKEDLPKYAPKEYAQKNLPKNPPKEREEVSDEDRKSVVIEGMDKDEDVLAHLNEDSNEP